MGLSKAKREQLVGALGLMGPSGSGKTLGALLMAYGMMKEKYPDATDEEIWEKIGLVDTEHKRSLIYVGMDHHGITLGQFWHYNLEKPFSVENYKKAMDAVVQAGAEVIVIDSTTHAWEGEGGILDYQQGAGGNFQAWNETNKKAYAPLVELFTGQTHGVTVINTMRTKQEYAMIPDDNGKLGVQKLGMKPVQRDSFEYEFHIVFSVDMENMAKPSKDNSSMFVGTEFQLSPEIGKKIQQWLGTGTDVFAERREAAAKEEAERLKLVEQVEALLTTQELKDYVRVTFEEHATINRPLAQFPKKFLVSTLNLVNQKIAAETAKGANK